MGRTKIQWKMPCTPHELNPYVRPIACYLVEVYVLWRVRYRMTRAGLEERSVTWQMRLFAAKCRLRCDYTAS